MITFLLDVDNKTRHKLAFNDTQEYDILKDSIKSFRRFGENLHFDIKNLGVAQVEAVIADFKGRVMIIKSSLILDYNMLEEDELEVDYGAGI